VSSERSHPVRSPGEVIDELVAALLTEIPTCQAIYRFGSWGSEAQRTDSDIDLAIMPLSSPEPVRLWMMAQTLASLAGRDLDLIDLLAAPTVLRMQVIAGGELLHCTDPDLVARFEDMVFSSYARLNEERRGILSDIRQRGTVFG
jgi:uncharacterized protein